LNLQKDLASLNDVKSYDADIIIHEEIACTPDDILEEIFKEMDKKEGLNSDNNDVEGDSDIATINHVRPTPSHDEALNCVSQLLTYS
jgi:predicted transcriptional regulator